MGAIKNYSIVYIRKCYIYVSIIILNMFLTVNEHNVFCCILNYYFFAMKSIATALRGQHLRCIHFAHLEYYFLTES